MVNSKTLAATALAQLLVLGLALPVAAQNRDSDGDVISVIVYEPTPVPGGGTIYFTFADDTTTRFSLDTTTTVGGGVALPQQVSIDGTLYRVESDGGEVYVRPKGGQTRILANVVSVDGRRVNPRAFALD